MNLPVNQVHLLLVRERCLLRSALTSQKEVEDDERDVSAGRRRRFMGSIMLTQLTWFKRQADPKGNQQLRCVTRGAEVQFGRSLRYVLITSSG